MSFFSRKKHPPADGLTSQSTQQPLPVCTWSAHVPQSGPSPSPLPRSYHTLTATATGTGELFIFGGHIGSSFERSSDLYVLSTRDLDLSTTLMHTSGEGPSPRGGHGAALIGTKILICGGDADISDDALYLLDLESREWTRVVVNGPGPGDLFGHTTTVVGSKLYVFGEVEYTNDLWTLDLNCLPSQYVWESIETSPGNEKPPGRFSHVSVTTENRIIIFGGSDNEQCYNDTWSFDISTRKWTELQCTGSVPSPRRGHAAALVDDAMYVFGGLSPLDNRSLGDLYALHLSTQRWFNFHNVGSSPLGRWGHAMASDGTRVFLLGGKSIAREGNLSLLHAFDTSFKFEDTEDIKYPEPEGNTADPNEKTSQLARKSSTGTQTEEQPRHPLAAQSERDHHIAQLTGELALKNALLEQAEANAVEAARRADDRQLTTTSLVKQRDEELADVQARLRDVQAKLVELLLSRDQQIGQYEKELANVRAKLEAKESESEAARLRFKDAEKDLTKSKAEIDALRAQTASGSVNRYEDQVTRRLMERVRALEAVMTSKRLDEKSIVDMECRNED